MNGTNLFKIALRALANNKLRAFLTMLGIIIGVASVITMLAIGQGSKKSIQAQISEMGSNMIMIHPGNGKFGGVRQSASSMQTLKLEDYEAIVRDVDLIDKCTPSVNSSGQVIYGANNAPTTIYGVNQDYLDIRKFSVGCSRITTSKLPQKYVSWDKPSSTTYSRREKNHWERPSGSTKPPFASSGY